MSNASQIYNPSGAIKTLDTQVLSTDKAQTTASVIHWRIPWSSTDFQDVKVTNGWALKTESSITNVAWDVINPATEEGIQDVVTAIENISIPAPVGWATETTQVEISNLTNALYELIARLSFLPSVRWVLSDLRVTPTWNVWVTGTLAWVTTVTSVTTLSTLSNQTSVGWYFANNIVPSQMNNLAIQSNINNIIVV